MSSSSDSMSNIGGSVLTQVSVLLTSAFGILAGLALNDAFKALLDKYYPPEKRDHIGVKFIYAAITLLVCATIIVILGIGISYIVS